MSHVFISYQNVDSDFAALLMLQLERAGIDTWMDKERLRPGYDWSEAIDDAIRDSFAMVLVMSPEAKASEYVTYEWAHAIAVGIRVVPVMIRDTPLHPRLARIQYLKFTDPVVRPWEALIRELQEEAAVGSTFRLPSSAPAYIRRALADLDSPREKDRSAAIITLAEAKDPAAKEALVHAMKHPLRDVRVHATICVGKTGDPRCLPGMGEAVLSEHRYHVRDVLERLGEPSHPALLTWLRDGPPELQEVAISVIATLGHLELVPALVEVAKREDQCGTLAIRALTGLKNEEVLPIVFSAIGNEDTDGKRLLAAFDAIAELAPSNGGPAVMRFLDDALKRGDADADLPEWVYAAATTLRSVGNCETAAGLIAHLSAPNPSARILAADTLGHLRCPDAVADLSRLWYDNAQGAPATTRREWGTKISVSSVAKHALRAIGTPEAFLVLNRAP